MVKPAFPVKGGSTWTPQGILWAKYCAIYGDDFVRRECFDMEVWLISNPDRLKTERGMPRFMGGWLLRASRASRQAEVLVSREPGIYSGPKMSEEEVEELRAKIGRVM